MDQGDRGTRPHIGNNQGRFGTIGHLRFAKAAGKAS